MWKPTITYDSLLAKKSIKVIGIQTELMDKKTALNEARKNVKNLYPFNSTFIRASDIDALVSIGIQGLKHTLRRGADKTAYMRILPKIGEILESSIRFNELMDRGDGRRSLIMVGIAADGEHFYPTVFNISKSKDVRAYEIENIDCYCLHSASTKKIELCVANYTPTTTTVYAGSVLFEMSITNLLEIVKETDADIIPLEVSEKLGIRRPLSKRFQGIIF